MIGFRLALLLMLSRTAASFLPFARRTIMSVATQAAAVSLSFGKDSPADAETTVLIGKKESLQSMIDSDDLAELLGDDETTKTILSTMLKNAKEKSSVSSYLPTTRSTTGNSKVVIGVLPAKVSRNNHPLSVHTVTSLVS